MEFCYGAVLIVTCFTIELYRIPKLAPFDRSAGARLPSSEGLVLGHFELPREAKSAAITSYVHLLADGTDPSGRTHPDRPLSILVRLKNGAFDEIRHYVLRPSLYSSRSAPDYTPYEFPPKLIQARSVHTHFYPEIQINASGRGFWVENHTAVNVSKPKEHLIGFVPGVRKHIKCAGENNEWEDGPELIDIEGSCRILGPQHDVLNCTDCSFDDAEGRIAIGNYNGRVKILDFA